MRGEKGKKRMARRERKKGGGSQADGRKRGEGDDGGRGVKGARRQRRNLQITQADMDGKC